MPPRFEWNIADLWLPAAMQRSDDPQTPRGRRAFQAHLRPGVTAAEAEAQLNVVGARRAAERPNDYPPGFRWPHAGISSSESGSSPCRRFGGLWFRVLQPSASGCGKYRAPNRLMPAQRDEPKRVVEPLTGTSSRTSWRSTALPTLSSLTQTCAARNRRGNLPPTSNPRDAVHRRFPWRTHGSILAVALTFDM
jgi:hypothetical protein